MPVIRARAFIAAACLIWTAAAAHDAWDRFIDATVLPPLAQDMSVEVLARDGTLLRAYTVADGRWRMPVALADVDPGYVAMLLAYEDRRFRRHGGVDARSVGRAAWQALRAGRVVSGGSTLTMQVARLLEEGGTGRIAGKLRQARVAFALERRLTKDGVLQLYLDRAPYGGNLEGVRAASLAYFGKEPRRLTPAQAALLVALPQSPEARRPDRFPAAGEAARARVLARAVKAGVIDPGQARAALREPVPDARIPVPALAPHLADRMVAAAPGVQRIATTIDRALQIRLEALAAQAVASQGARMQVAIVVADHATGAVLASVGSSGYRDDARAGFVDMTRAVRSPGSTLKPLVYGLAFDQGLVHPETLIEDAPVDFAGYRPQNFDHAWHGEVRVREALQMSLNIPVVALTDAMGPQHLLAGLRRAGVEARVPGGRPGLAVALGGLGVTLEDLVALYAAIARGGEAVALRHAPDGAPASATGSPGAAMPAPPGMGAPGPASPGSGPAAPPGPAARVMSKVAAWEVGDILAGLAPPAGAPANRLAYKTGTSYGNRDAWAVGFDGAHVAGVWMGRADGTPVPGAFGADLAAPVLFQAFARIGRDPVSLRPPPPATLLVANAQLPQPLRRFRSRTAAFGAGPDAPAVAFPPDGAEVEAMAGGVLLRVAGGTAPFTWLADGRPVAVGLRARDAVVALPGPGFVTLSVIDAQGRSARASVRLR